MSGGPPPDILSCIFILKFILLCADVNSIKEDNPKQRNIMDDKKQEEVKIDMVSIHEAAFLAATGLTVE